MVRGETLPHDQASMVALLKWLMDNVDMPKDIAREIYRMNPENLTKFADDTKDIWENNQS